MTNYNSNQENLYIDNILINFDNPQLLNKQQQNNKLLFGTLNNNFIKCLGSKKCLQRSDILKNNANCDICCYKKKKYHWCNCNIISCLDCIKRYNDYKCSNCKEILPISILKQDYDNKGILYKKYFVTQYISLYREQDLKNILLKYINIKQLRLGIYQEYLNYTIIDNCKQIQCNGQINNEFICLICKTKYCSECEEIYNTNHVCDPLVKNNILYLRSTTKKCPICYTNIEKISNTCNDMRCVSCGCYFNWSNLYIDFDIVKNSNRHYDKAQPKYAELYDIYIKNTVDKYTIENISFKDNYDYQIYKLFLNFKNQFSRLNKNKIKYEYLYFARKNQNDYLIDKLYNIYKSLDYSYKLYDIFLGYKSKSLTYNKIKFLNCSDLFLNKNKLIKFNKYNNECIIKPIKTKRQKKIIICKNDNPVDLSNYNKDIYDHLSKYKICILDYINIESIIQTILKLSINKITLVCSKLSFYTWLNILEKKYNISLFYIYLPSISKSVLTNQDILTTLKLKKKFIEESVLIIYGNYTLYKNNPTILQHLINEYLSCQSYIISVSESSPSISKYLFTYYKQNTNKIFDMIAQLPKNKFINIITNYYKKFKFFALIDIHNNNNIFQNCNSKYIYYPDIVYNEINNINESLNKYDFMLLHEHYLKNYLIDSTFQYNIYRIDRVFCLYMICCKDLIIHNHHKCIEYKRCVYCKECSDYYIDSDSRINIYKRYNKTGISMCCYIHSLSYTNNVPICKEILPIYTKLTSIHNFSHYELNILFYINEDYFLNIMAKYQIHLYNRYIDTVSAIETSTYYNEDFNAHRKHYISSYMIKNTLPIYIYIRDDLIYEYDNLEKIMEYIFKNINNKLLHIKFILCLYFNQNIEFLQKKYINHDNILYIYKKTPNQKTIENFTKFATNDYYNVLVYTSNTELPNIPIKNKYMLNIISLRYRDVNKNYNLLNILPMLYNNIRLYTINHIIMKKHILDN